MIEKVLTHLGQGSISDLPMRVTAVRGTPN